MPDDGTEIRRMLEDRLESVLDAIAPGWARRGNTAYLTPKGPKDLGSYQVHLRNGRMPRGSWYRFSQGVGGGVVELVGYQMFGSKDRYREAFAWARDFLGLERREQSPEEREAFRRRQAELEAERAARARRQAEQAARQKERRLLTAAEVWAETQPLAGTHGDAYLEARGIAPVRDWPWSPDDAIRFHSGLDYELDRSRGRFPAIIAKVVDAFGDLIAVWRIYLDRDKPAKAPVDNPKVGLGPASGGAVRIGGDAEDIGVCEGLETGLAAWELDGYRRPCWSLLSTSGMASFEPPPFVRRVRTWPDGDYGKLTPQRTLLDPPGMRAAMTLNQRLVAAGIDNPVNDVTRHGDALDMLVACKAFERRAS